MDWKKIKAEYISGGTSYRKLAEKYAVPIATLKRIAKKENWVELRSQTDTKTDTNLTEKISAKKASRATRITSVAETLLTKMEDTVEKLPVIDGKTMKSYVTALKELQGVFGICPSKLDEQEQKARIRRLEQDAEKGERSGELIVTFDGEMEDYAE